MAMRKCKECGGQVSTKADVCPHCGFNIKKATDRKAGCLGMVVIAVVVLLAVGKCSDDQASNTSNREGPEAQNRSEKEILHEMKWSMSQETRRNIWLRMCKARKDAHEAAIRLFPPVTPSTHGRSYSSRLAIEQGNKMDAEEERLVSAEFDRIAGSTGLTRANLDEIDVESIQRKWIPPKSKEEIRQEQIEKQFSPWDGSHRGVIAYVKQIMHNPKSFEHVSTRYGDAGNHIVVRMSYRGTNMLGGVVLQGVVAKVSLDGVVLECGTDE